MMSTGLRAACPASALHSPRTRRASPPAAPPAPAVRAAGRARRHRRCHLSAQPAGPSVQATPPQDGNATGLGFQGLHHVAVCCASLERSLDFYCGLLGACPRLA